MKLFFSVALLAVSIQAQSAGACNTFIPCGVYEGEGKNVEVTGEVTSTYLEKMVIRGVDADTVELESFVKHEGVSDEDAFHLVVMVHFEADGRFTAIEGDEVLANGSCVNFVCNVSFVPFFIPQLKSTGGNMNILRFENSKLKRYMIASTSFDDVGLQISELSKK